MTNHFEEGVEEKVEKKGKGAVIALIVVGIIIGVAGFWAWDHFVGNKVKVNTVDQASVEQTKAVLAQVGKLIILPVGEDPIVATINDAASLIKDQVFYKGAQNGDVVIVYQKAAKAIVYSPSRNMIVNVGPVFLQDQTQATNAETKTTN